MLKVTMKLSNLFYLVEFKKYKKMKFNKLKINKNKMKIVMIGKNYKK